MATTRRASAATLASAKPVPTTPARTPAKAAITKIVPDPKGAPPAPPAPGTAQHTEAFRGTSKRERILRAAVDVFARNGYFNAKVSEIAKAAGVADGTIYLYFDGKEDLLVTIFREHTRGYLQSLEREMVNIRRADDRIRVAIRHHLETLGRDKALAVVAQVELRHSLKFMSLLSQQEVADYLNMIRKIIEQGQHDGVFRRNLHPQLVAKSVFGILDEMVTSWILSEKEHALADQAEPIADLILNGLLPSS
ncbi:MAG: Transcriptional regulator [Acidobacteria bacterium]|nr:Transcriptional regulator [Acidobacteriota bacterium]